VAVLGTVWLLRGLAVNTQQQWAYLLRAVSEPSAAGGSDTLLRQAVELCRDVAPDAVGCSVTTLDGDRFFTPVSSGQLALDLDRAQYAAGDGPCMAAAREHRFHNFDAATDAARFPGFAEAAVERGVRSSISVPLTGPPLRSAINLYGSTRYTFDAERPRAVAGLLARCVSALMSSGGVSQPAVSLPAARIEAARARARLIADAQAVLISAHPVDRPEAMAILIRRSRAENRSIFEIAREVVGNGAGEARL
jgi:hypothetical protein